MSEQKISGQMGLALEAFRKIEQAELRRDRFTRELLGYVSQLTPEEKAVYFEESEKILAEFAEKRDKEGLR